MNNLTKSPFLLNNDSVFKHWRVHKLLNTPNYSQHDPSSLFIDIENASKPSTTEIKKIFESCKKNSFCLYRIKDQNTDTKKNIHALAKHIGLSRLDGNICADADKLTSITQSSHKGQHEYIPYSNKRSGRCAC